MASFLDCLLASELSFSESPLELPLEELEEPLDEPLEDDSEEEDSPSALSPSSMEPSLAESVLAFYFLRPRLRAERLLELALEDSIISSSPSSP